MEPRLWGDDCYSTGVGFKNAFLMGGGGDAFHRRELRAPGKPVDAAAVAGAPSAGTACHLLAEG